MQRRIVRLWIVLRQPLFDVAGFDVARLELASLEAACFDLICFHLATVLLPASPQRTHPLRPLRP
jgi:hypothetical protein